MENIKGVRKGAWSQEEDTRLRDCINKFGEGRWHLVSLRAGLNRCRKSCRLRWLNYLRPNLKRGYFSKDEVDLIVRLHKLLGNRWSLIAGRIPGRTANDIKNFWNTHIVKNKKKLPSPPSSSAGKTITKSNILRPRPRKLSSNSSQLSAWSAQLARSNLIKPRKNDDDIDPTKKNPSSSASPSTSPPVEILADDRNGNIPMNSASKSLEEDLDECIRWWGDLLEMAENGGEQTPFISPVNDDLPITEPMLVAGDGDEGFQLEQFMDFNDLYIS